MISNAMKPAIQNSVPRRSSNSRAPRGVNAAHNTTALDCRNPPRLIITRHGKIKTRRSWVNR